ncbi:MULTISPECIES: hypothetical protein [unclassified Chitinophaga]|uniref:hypothetical protein n=1 Tax=unclassified Chitinophaga TaxID=2619133 RepID=UPI0009D222DA|nr:MULTISPECIES: hypothetical protein [unclassified Chitinophaga]OMP75730.1 hypothetical protein BW716_28715 [[Flexibacter] sp. ATCC 35208]WPV70300.1 hypothetical protein QQL36_16455 [Chitinophaga sp. LS1]
MKTNISLFTKIATRSLLAWLRVVIPGLLLSVVGLIVSINIIGSQPGPGYAGARAVGVGAVLGVFVLFNVAFWSCLLFVISLAGFVLFPSLASGYTIKTALFLVWDNKLGDFFIDKISDYLDRVWLRGEKQINAKESIKALKLEVQKDTNTNKLQKRLLNYLLKRVRLDDVDWQAPPAEIKHAILEKFKVYIGEKLMPSKLVIRLAMILPIVLMILALIYDK